MQLFWMPPMSFFGSGGFYETKMSEVAERAGIAKGTVYLYFKKQRGTLHGGYPPRLRRLSLSSLRAS
ncbi:helix-turn-helix domain-containing protein [Paenibacillus rhizoplanae]